MQRCGQMCGNAEDVFTVNRQHVLALCHHTCMCTRTRVYV